MTSRFFVYVLWSEKLRKRYVGYTPNVAGRLEQHNAGWTKFTSGGVPWVLVYTEEYRDKLIAQRRERYLKTGAGREFLNLTLSRVTDYPQNRLPDACLSFHIC